MRPSLARPRRWRPDVGSPAVDPLTPDELRVLGVLIEKWATTPDQYPLTLNALVAGVNQTSNRNPVVSWDAERVRAAVDALRARGLARVVHGSGGARAERYRQVLQEQTGFTDGELAVLAVLALRGPQTAGELATRTERYPGLEEMGGVPGVLHRLRTRYDHPHVARLERQPGQREERWAHLLAGEVIDVPAAAPAGRPAGGGTPDRVAALEAQVAALAAEVAALRADLSALRSELG